MRFLSLLLTPFFLLPAFAHAQTPPGIDVEFESSPLFSEANFLPNDSVTRFIQVTNNRDTSRLVVTEAINENDASGLASVLDLIITEGATTLWSGTLAQFFSAGPVALSNIANTATTQYDFTVTFNGGANDTYQEAALGFDIIIGFQGEEAVGSDGNIETTNPLSGGPPQGQGGLSGAQGLTITNESAIAATGNDVLISWQTNYAATSRVIYGTTPGLFDANSPPNYGYLLSTIEYNTPASLFGVTNHAVLLSGLLPNTVYYYRVISSASPPTVGFERSFALASQPNNPLLESQPPQDDAPTQNNTYSPSRAATSLDTERTILVQRVADGFIPPSLDADIETEDEATNTSGTGSAQVLDSFGADWPWWVLGILILGTIAYFVFRGKQK